MHRPSRLSPAPPLLAVLAIVALAMLSINVVKTVATPVRLAAFAQSAGTHLTRAASASVTMAGPLTGGDRIVVEVGVWNYGNPGAASVTDSAGNTYAKILAFRASDGAEMSVWTASVTAGAGTRPSITATPTAVADIGLVAVEYSGLSSAAGIASVDRTSQATGTASAAGVVSAGATLPATADGVAVGFYADSGFNSVLSAGTGYTERANISRTSDMNMLVEDQTVTSGATPAATAGTSAGAVWQMATVVFKGGGPAPPATAPAAPAGVTATPGNASATVSWTAPADGGSALTSYTVTPYAGTTPLAATVVTGAPPATSATVTGLTNGTAYTVTVSATNAVGPGPASAPSPAVTPVASTGPAFVQQASAQTVRTASASATPPAPIAAGDRLVVQVETWRNPTATTTGVTDTAGNTYTRLATITASDNAEMTVWSAPVTAGAGTRPTVTAATTAGADTALAVLEYRGLSLAAGTGVLDQSAQATGRAAAGATVSSGPTPPTSAAGLFALGFYGDSGFNTTLTPGTGFTSRVNLSPGPDSDVLAEDQAVAAGATPAATARTSASAVWMMITLALRTDGGPPPAATAPAAPTGVTAVAGNASAAVSWAAPADGGSALTSYTVTPFAGTTALAPTVVSGTPPATSTTVNGLTNGTAYTFTVTATNAVGTSPPSSPSAAVTPAGATGGSTGQWGPVQDWPFVALSAVALKDGTYILWDGWQRPNPTYIWNPATGAFTRVNAASSIFCGGNALMPDGKVLTIGGYGIGLTGTLGIKDTNIFDPATATWNRVADMANPRWYPSLTQLADGRYVAISGNTTDSLHWAETPEVYDPAANTWTPLTGVDTSGVHEDEYPFSFLTPNGKVFTIGPSEDHSYQLDVPARTWTPVGPSGVVNGSAVMYRPGKIMYSGGAADLTSAPSAATTAVIDTTAANPAWRTTAPMNNSRTYHTLTNLADGTVLAIGGQPTANQATVTTGVLPTEIWNPATETWTAAAPIAVARNYHSTAILMPDGRVLSAGGGHTQGATGAGQFSAQIYSPPYLFGGARPTISAAPASTAYGATMTVSTPQAASIRSVNLVSLGADTHQSDMNQHFVPLSFTAGQGSLSVAAPASAAVAPAGTYMLFVVDASGVPSVAAMVDVKAAATTPSAPTGLTAVPGNGSVTVGWAAPADGGSPLTSYTVTPYAGGVAQPPVTVAAPSTGTTVTGLTNGTPYTFTVTARNAVGAGPASQPSASATPTTALVPVFVQQASTHVPRGTATSVTLPSPVTVGNRLVVEVGVWSDGRATTAGVQDSAGNTYTALTRKVATDGTELSVWSAPVTSSGAVTSVTATTTGPADVGVAALEYSGLSAAAGTAVLDQSVTASGTTGTSPAQVNSGATLPASSAGAIALGFYADSGFNVALSPSSGYAVRTNVSRVTDMQLLVEDAAVNAGDTPNAGTNTGARTTWLMATLVLRRA